MAPSSRLLPLARKTHRYFGIFISPALLFFALSGALQTFSLHEVTPGSSYKPPAWINELAQLHKKQTLTGPVKVSHPDAEKSCVSPDTTRAATVGDRASRKGKESVEGGPSTANATAPSAPSSGPAAPVRAPKRHLPMKIFFLVVSIGLFTSTCTGIYMAYRFERTHWVVSGLLAAGFLVLLLLVRF